MLLIIAFVIPKELMYSCNIHSSLLQVTFALINWEFEGKLLLSLDYEVQFPFKLGLSLEKQNI